MTSDDAVSTERIGQRHSTPLWLGAAGLAAGLLLALLLLSPALLPGLYRTARNRDVDKGCRQDLSCWTERNLTSAERQCTRAIAAKATDGLRWTNDWLQSIFFNSHALSPDNSVLEYVGDDVQFRQRDGAWKTMSYYCSLDTRNGRLRALKIVTGDNPDD